MMSEAAPLKKEGHIFVVLGFEGSWPPSRKRTIYEGLSDKNRIVVSALPNGSLEFVVEYSQSDLIRNQTQSVHFRGTGMFIFEASWRDQNVQIRLNGNLLPSRIIPTRPIVIDLKTSLFPPNSSIDEPDARGACKKWIEWRKARFGSPKQNPNRNILRIKSFDEQVSELRYAISALEHHLRAFESGKKFVVPDVATSLRALVYWENSKAPKYSPLLLRIAGRLEPPLPLPVFAFGEKRHEVPEVIESAQMRVTNPWISIYREFPQQRLMDIQDVLNETLQVERFDARVLDKGFLQAMTFLDLIREFASSSATGHYHEYIRRDFDRLHNSGSFETPISYQLILRLAQVVIFLGNHIVGIAEKRS